MCVNNVFDARPASGWSTKDQNRSDSHRLRELTSRCGSEKDLGDGGREEKGLPRVLQSLMGSVVVLPCVRVSPVYLDFIIFYFFTAPVLNGNLFSFALTACEVKQHETFNVYQMWRHV